jgi:hypothetical protein
VYRLRRGLKVVGSVPEFNDAPERVAALETRLESLVGPLYKSNAVDPQLETAWCQPLSLPLEPA